MPLDKSGSKASVSANIRELKATGKYPQRQAVAIALDTQRRARGVKKRSAPRGRRRSR